MNTATRPVLNCLQLYYNPACHTGDIPTVSIAVAHRTLTWPFEYFGSAVPFADHDPRGEELFTDLNNALQYSHSMARHELTFHIFERLNTALETLEQAPVRPSHEQWYETTYAVRECVEQLLITMPGQELVGSNVMRRPIPQVAPGWRREFGFEADEAICEQSLQLRLLLPVLSRVLTALQRAEMPAPQANLETVRMLSYNYFGGWICSGQNNRLVLSGIRDYVEHLVGQYEPAWLPDYSRNERLYQDFDLLTATVTIEHLALGPTELPQSTKIFPLQRLREFVLAKLQDLVITEDMRVPR